MRRCGLRRDTKRDNLASTRAIGWLPSAIVLPLRSRSRARDAPFTNQDIAIDGATVLLRGQGSSSSGLKAGEASRNV
jgi:hypothetical protein